MKCPRRPRQPHEDGLRGFSTCVFDFQRHPCVAARLPQRRGLIGRRSPAQKMHSRADRSERLPMELAGSSQSGARMGQRDDRSSREQALRSRPRSLARDRRPKNPAWMDPSSRADTCSGAVRSAQLDGGIGCRRAKSRMILAPLRSRPTGRSPRQAGRPAPHPARCTDRAACSALCDDTARASAGAARPAGVSSTRAASIGGRAVSAAPSPRR